MIEVDNWQLAKKIMPDVTFAFLPTYLHRKIKMQAINNKPDKKLPKPDISEYFK